MTQDQLTALAHARNEAIGTAATAFDLATAVARGDREISKAAADRIYEEHMKLASARRVQAYQHADIAFVAATTTQRDAYEVACAAAERAYYSATGSEGGQ